MKRILGVLLTVLAVLLSGVQAGMVAARTVGRQAAGALEGLLRTAAWQQFKAFWRRIGLIPPKRPATDGTRRLAISDAPYAHVIGKEEHDRLGKELGDRLAALSAAGFPKDDLDFLEQVVRARLGNMLHGPTSMLTRMVPSANMIEEEKSLQMLDSIEKRRKKAIAGLAAELKIPPDITLSDLIRGTTKKMIAH